jgi:hypothetical protein
VLALAAALSIGAAAIHAVVVPSHLAEDRLYGAFFVASSAAQIGWAVAVVLRPHRLVLEVGALGNAAVLALWALTRTLGVPLGVYAGQREAIGLLDTTCAALELGIVGCCLLALRPTRTPIHA